ncbi:helix-turn-helix transcriptional regulator [Rhizobium leguminosarum]|uniref:Transcriptional regulator n=1 Tax=Rhizobium leguminosarum TaxID=384 RepID=A0A2K9ZH48_RHILE|nr:helix-turn-helix transcriptional regulator [Rhizobium leguminosarum]AUW47583.1 Transcriptional regulator [Rhizobium leguminosarum]
MPKLRKPTREEINAYRKRLIERAEAGALRYPLAVSEIRRTMGLTQEQFANLVQMTRRQIAEIERGEANPTVETMQRIGRIFGFTVGFVPKNPSDDEPEPALKM